MVFHIDPNEPPIEFRIHSNLIVLSKIIENCKKRRERERKVLLDCFAIDLVDRSTLNVNERCWIFSTRGLCTVAQDELIFIFNENVHNSDEIISDLLIHIHQIYLDATKGKSSSIEIS